jgi:thioredoxin 1
MAMELTDQNFDQIVGQKGVALVDFWAVWCGPCRAVAPVIEQLSSEYDGKAVVAKVDVDNNPETAVKYGIRSIPTVVVFKDGEIVDKIVGATTKSVYASKLDAAIGVEA